MDASDDEGFAFPVVGEDVSDPYVCEDNGDHDHQMHQRASELDYQFCVAVQSANVSPVAALKAGGQPESIHVPTSEPTAGSSCQTSAPSQLPISEPTSASSSPTSARGQKRGNDSTQHEDATVVTPKSGGMTRRRIFQKRAEWEIMTPKKLSELPNPDVFCNHPCRITYANLSKKEKVAVASKVRQRKFRTLDRVKQGNPFEAFDKEFAWPEDVTQIELFKKDFDTAFYYDLAASPITDAGERGCAMQRLYCMYKAGLMTSLGEILEQQKLKQTSIMMTYNGVWGLLDDLTPPRNLSIFQLERLVREHERTKQLFAELCDQFGKLIEKRHIKQYIAAQEICILTWMTKGVVRVHVHVWIHKNYGFTVDLAELSWKGSPPFTNRHALEHLGGRGSKSVSASYSGAFYLQIDKIGAVRQCGTVSAHTSYQVKDYWITALLAAKKITVDTARSHYLQCVVRAENNIRLLEYVEKQALEMQLIRDGQEAEAEILRTERGFRFLPEVEAWRMQFATVKSRYTFLVLDGPSRTGKTRFAYSLSPPPTSGECSATTPEREFVYYADCSGGLPDLRKFRRAQHRLLVLDELHPKNAMVLKKIMQASNDSAIMGASPTMQHAYVVNTFRTMIVVTTNTWASGLADMPSFDVDWLRVNSVYVLVTTPLWLP